MNVAALTDHWFTPSSRYRVRSHIPFLSRHGIEVTDLIRNFSTESSGLFFPNRRISKSPLKMAAAVTAEIANIASTFARSLRSNCFDATWLSRELIIGYPSFEIFLKKPLIYDIDDAVFLSKSSRLGVDYLIANSIAVFAGNSYLADYCSGFNSNVHLVPTSVEVDRFRHSLKSKNFDTFKIGWSGTYSASQFFYPIQNILANFLKGKPDANLIFFLTDIQLN